VPGIEHHRHLGAARQAAEFQQCPAHLVVRRILHLRHREAEPLERLGDVAGIVCRIGQCRYAAIGGIADHERNLASSVGRCVQKCRC
jgi:hypothetical protein